MLLDRNKTKKGDSFTLPSSRTVVTKLKHESNHIPITHIHYHDSADKHFLSHHKLPNSMAEADDSQLLHSTLSFIKRLVHFNWILHSIHIQFSLPGFRISSVWSEEWPAEERLLWANQRWRSCRRCRLRPCSDGLHSGEWRPWNWRLLPFWKPTS